MYNCDFNEWLLAFLQISLTYSLITILHLIIPARLVRGYVHDGPPFYRLNGLRVFLIMTGLFFVSVEYFHLFSIDHLVQLRFQHSVCACALGIIFTFVLVIPYQARTSSFWLDIYLGRLKNPQWFGNRADAKMLLYLIGGVGLEFNLLILYFEHKIDNLAMTNVTLYVLLFSFFLIEYFYHEHVHLYTFDFIVEHLGFKLIWGCLVFYPFFYPIAIWFSIRSTLLTSKQICFSIIVFFFGWILSRGANNQKYLFRTKPTAKFLVFIEPKSIKGRLLCSGWWSLSRHINYLGDTLMAAGLSLAVNSGLGPWLYPVYYVTLFIARERTDFQRCQEKYGHDWNEYCRRVPYRIIPFVY